MRIAIDFDDVIVNTVPHVLGAINRSQPENLYTWQLKDITEWNLSRITGFSESTIDEFFERIPFDNLVQQPGAVDALKALSRDKHELVILTSNPRASDVYMWVFQNTGLDLPVVNTRHKYAWMLEHGYDLLIDDNPNTLEDVWNGEGSVRAIRFVRPWNKCLEGKFPFIQLSSPSWDDVLRLVRNLSEHFDKSEGIITNANGARQSDIGARYDLLPARALREVAGVLKIGAEKYGEENWRGLSVAEIHNHTLGHAIAFNNSNKLEDLSHTACRALMALEIFLLSDEASEEVGITDAHLDYDRCKDA